MLTATPHGALPTLPLPYPLQVLRRSCCGSSAAPPTPTCCATRTSTSGTATAAASSWTAEAWDTGGGSGGGGGSGTSPDGAGAAVPTCGRGRRYRGRLRTLWAAYEEAERLRLYAAVQGERRRGTPAALVQHAVVNALHSAIRTCPPTHLPAHAPLHTFPPGRWATWALCTASSGATSERSTRTCTPTTQVGVGAMIGTKAGEAPVWEVHMGREYCAAGAGTCVCGRAGARG